MHVDDLPVHHLARQPDFIAARLIHRQVAQPLAQGDAVIVERGNIHRRDHEILVLPAQRDGDHGGKPLHRVDEHVHALAHDLAAPVADRLIQQRTQRRH